LSDISTPGYRQEALVDCPRTGRRSDIGNTRKKDVNALRGFVHTAPSSAFTGMRYASLERRYP